MGYYRQNMVDIWACGSRQHCQHEMARWRSASSSFIVASVALPLSAATVGNGK